MAVAAPAATADGLVLEGDHLIVEPGARATPGRLVVVEGPASVALGRLDHDAAGQVVVRATDADLLPLVQPLDPAEVVGPVVAIIRGGRALPVPATSQPSLFQAPPAATDVALLRDLEAWQRWLEALPATGPDAAAGPSPQAAQRCGVANRLATLRSCIESTHRGRLHDALVGEAQRLLAVLARATKRSRPSARRGDASRSAETPKNEEKMKSSATRH